MTERSNKSRLTRDNCTLSSPEKQLTGICGPERPTVTSDFWPPPPQHDQNVRSFHGDIQSTALHWSTHFIGSHQSSRWRTIIWLRNAWVGRAKSFTMAQFFLFYHRVPTDHLNQSNFRPIFRQMISFLFKNDIKVSSIYVLLCSGR